MGYPKRLQAALLAMLTTAAGASCHAAVPMPTQGQASVAPAIDEISIERRCGGCEREMKLTLKRDGTAERVQFGNPRIGRADRPTTASIAATAFSALANDVVADGFFGLLDTYTDPQIMDGEFVVTTVQRGGETKSVTDRAGKAPEVLKKIQQRIEAAAEALAWR